MISNPSLRHGLAFALVLVGAVLMLLAPPVWMGIIPVAAGVLLEVIGITIGRMNHTYRRPRYARMRTE